MTTTNENTIKASLMQRSASTKYILRRLSHNFKLEGKKYLPVGNLAAMERQVCAFIDSQTVNQSSFSTMLSFNEIAKVIETIKESLPACEDLLRKVEAVILFLCKISQASNWEAVLLDLASFMHAMIPGSILKFCKDNIIDRFHALFSDLITEQSWDSEENLSWLEEGATLIREKMDFFSAIKDIPIMLKLHKFSLYCLSLGLFSSLGLDFDVMGYTKFEERAIIRAHSSKVGFLYNLFDCASLFCKQFISSVRIGSFEPFYHSGDSYAKWVDRVILLKQREKFLTNPEPHGFNIFDFRTELDSCLEIGVEIVKATKNSNKTIKDRLQMMYSDLRMMKSNDISKKSAQRDRASPFGILFSGGSSLGKSTLINIVFQYYAKRFKYSNDTSCKYTRNPGEAYWNGFTTSQWCIVMDDIAAQNPCLNTDDLSLKEIIGVMNNVAYQPDQASLEDKGKTPVQAKLVIATTNTEHLNAHAYFSCPLAVQRRLPWVIDVVVKEEYATNRMLDHTKCSKIPNQYANYWNLTVKKVVPASDDPLNKKGKTIDYKLFTDIAEFLQWFGETVVVHETVQATIGAEEKETADICVCSNCSLPSYACYCNIIDICAICNLETCVCTMQEQTLRITNGTWSDWFSMLTTWTTEDSLSLCYTISVYISMTLYYIIALLMGPVIMYYCSDSLVQRIVRIDWNDRLFRFIVRRIGTRFAERYTPLIMYGKAFALLSISFYVGSKVLKKAIGATFGPVRYPCKNCGLLEGTDDIYGEGDLPMNTCFGTKQSPVKDDCLEQVAEGRRPEPTSDQRENVWYKNEFVVSRFDVTPQTTSWRALSQEDVKNKIRNNVLRVDICLNALNGRRTGMLALGGQLYAINTHAIPKVDTFSMSIIRGLDDQGINQNHECIITKNQMYHAKNSDITYLWIKGLPPYKDITGLIPKESFNGRYNGDYVGYNSMFSQFDKNVIKITSDVMFDGERDLQFFSGEVNSPTENGDCGNPLIAFAPLGPVLCGIHARGSASGVIMAARLFITDVELAREQLQCPMVQAGEPSLNAPSATVRSIIALDKKSPFRYLHAGHASVYGSLNGHRPHLKSCVQRTLIATSCEERYGMKQLHGKPDFGTWQPWYKAASDMVQIPSTFRDDILDAAVEGFTKDIMKGLTEDDLKQVHVYDMFTAINGAAGVAYVDKINRNTSTGFPWCKSKRHFMTEIEPLHNLQSVVKISPEIEVRVDHIIDCYLNNTRYVPIFQGNLKDEALKYKKIIDYKIRLFGGAPLDWSIVNRMYFLSLTRLIQDNRFLFESAPGTIAQSREWDELYHYITYFGIDRIIAGDYKAFDKSMPPAIILAAFQILKNICIKAGYNIGELKVVDGIATDTAFPVFNFNGDIVEFYGSNPSGHPLTVIINGLANCLYMRYCYIIINPKHECYSFKENVHLMTYGDDNIMGVSLNASWFNHTSIQNVLKGHGVTYTMADKESASVPFVNISDVSFLKRTWRFDEDIGYHLCPLEEESIHKSLMIGVASKSISAEEQAVAIMSSACNEYFFYGKDVFILWRERFHQLVDDHNLQPYVTPTTFPSWEQLEERFHSYDISKSWREIC